MNQGKCEDGAAAAVVLVLLLEVVLLLVLVLNRKGDVADADAVLLGNRILKNVIYEIMCNRDIESQK